MSEPPSRPSTREDRPEASRIKPPSPPAALALNGLLLIALLTVMHLAREFVLPVVAALIFSLVFLPVVRGLKALWIPAPVSAGIVVLTLFGSFVYGAYALAEPAGIWFDKAPQGLREISRKLARVSGQVGEVNRVSQEVKEITQEMAQGGHAKDRAPEVTLKGATLAEELVDSAMGFSFSALSTLLLLYFLLASGDLFLRKTIAATPRLADKARATTIARQVEHAVSRYLFAITLVNIALGAVVALALFLLDVPNPLLWGVVVAVLNYVPYLGEIATISALTVVGLLSFDDVWRGLTVPAVYCVLSVIERYVVTPLVIGRRLSLNPVVIVLSVLFWGAMWGIPGALLAVPILVTLKVLCEHVPQLHVLGEFLEA